MTPGRRIVLVRHGETEWSLTGQHTGRTDLALNDVGRASAESVGRRLAGRRFALVLTSPLARAAETCRIAGFGAVAERCDDAMEWNYGAHEGRTSDEIRRDIPGWTVWTHGGLRGEVAADVAKRADRVIARLRAAGGDALLFSHGHFLRVLASRWIGLAPEKGACFALGTGSISELGYEHETPVLQLWNDVAHKTAPRGAVSSDAR